MNDDKDQTKSPLPEFDFSVYPRNTLFHDRRNGRDRRESAAPANPPPTPPVDAGGGERRAKKERRRRIDPTTFEKQYTDDEMEFMNAMQRFKELSGKTFPTCGDVIKVAISLGYRKSVVELESLSDELETDETFVLLAPSVDC